ncbi:ligand-effect modulator 3 family [Pavlovales sp. CCMP2436]|nr:ligand-effect modulator 3 family [Pavlovales sp. CCMP2436]
MAADGDAGAASRRPPNTPFRQQTLKAWRPILTPAWVIATFTAVGVAFIPIGAFCLVASRGVVEVISSPYDETCCESHCDDELKRVDRNPCTITVTPYYIGVLHGAAMGVTQSSDGCHIRSDESCANPSGEVSNAINPCGLIAWSLFNDTFTLTKTGGSKVPLVKSGIAWNSDVSTKFKNSDGTGNNFPPFASKCTEDEDFIVWMRTAGLPTFRKLYRRINVDLEAGEYSITIKNGEVLSGRGDRPINRWSNKEQNTLYPVTPFVVLTTTAWIGGRNDFLGYAYIIVGGVSLILALAFFVKHKISPRKLGDTSYLIWSKDQTH